MVLVVSSDDSSSSMLSLLKYSIHLRRTKDWRDGMYLSSLLCVAATGIGNVVDLFAARRDDDGVDRSAYGIIFDLLIYQVGSARVSVWRKDLWGGFVWSVRLGSPRLPSCFLSILNFHTKRHEKHCK